MLLRGTYWIGFFNPISDEAIPNYAYGDEKFSRTLLTTCAFLYDIYLFTDHVHEGKLFVVYITNKPS